jgi:hypothetical protein
LRPYADRTCFLDRREQATGGPTPGSTPRTSRRTGRKVVDQLISQVLADEGKPPFAVFAQ